MQSRSLDSVLAEFEDEGHAQMARFVSELARQPWAADLGYDVSMLRLWIARRGISRVEVMVTYGDGRHGGRPAGADLGLFDLTFFSDAGQEEVGSLDMNAAISRIQSWLA